MAGSVSFGCLQLKRYRTYCQLLHSKLVFHSSPSSQSCSREVVALTSPKYRSSLSSTILTTSPKKPRRPDRSLDSGFKRSSDSGFKRSSDSGFKVQRVRSGRLSCSMEEPES